MCLADPEVVETWLATGMCAETRDHPHGSWICGARVASPWSRVRQWRTRLWLRVGAMPTSPRGHLRIRAAFVSSSPSIGLSARPRAHRDPSRHASGAFPARLAPDPGAGVHSKASPKSPTISTPTNTFPQPDSAHSRGRSGAWGSRSNRERCLWADQSHGAMPHHFCSLKGQMR